MSKSILPISVDFNHEWEKQIGTATVDMANIPKDIDYHFEPCFRVNRSHQEGGVTVYDDVELIEISLVRGRSRRGDVETLKTEPVLDQDFVPPHLSYLKP